jgi:glycosyltransferase involved in cell wall biosynthesis
VFDHAAAVVVTTRGARTTYSERFPSFPRGRIELIENGYDEETFARAEGSGVPAGQAKAGPVTLLHSGIVYRSERDPTQLFTAVASLKARGALAGADLQLVFRASGEEAAYQRDIDRFGIADIVRLEPPVDYLSALREMLSVDGLLILQASNCNEQIPAKLYEYLRARRPILALTDPAGDTAARLQELGTGLIARLDRAADIETALLGFVQAIRAGTWRAAADADVTRFSRKAQTGQLASLLDRVIAG